MLNHRLAPLWLCPSLAPHEEETLGKAGGQTKGLEATWDEKIAVAWDADHCHHLFEAWTKHIRNT